MKHLFSIPNGEEWRQYSRRAARYGAQLREMGLALDNPERQRAHAAILRGIARCRQCERQHRAARHIIAALTAAQKQALAAA